MLSARSGESRSDSLAVSVLPCLHIERARGFTVLFIGLATHRRPLAEIPGTESNRLRLTRRGPVQNGIQVHLAWLEKQITLLGKDLDRPIRHSPLCRAKADLLDILSAIVRSKRPRGP